MTRSLAVLSSLLAAATAVSPAEDDSVVLRILSPRGRSEPPFAAPSPSASASRKRIMIHPQVDVEAFQGVNADILRADPGAWDLCYSASVMPPPSGTSSQVPEGKAAASAANAANATCTSLFAGDLPGLELPESAGIPGVAEQWRFDAWLRKRAEAEAWAGAAMMNWRPAAWP